MRPVFQAPLGGGLHKWRCGAKQPSGWATAQRCKSSGSHCLHFATKAATPPSRDAPLSKSPESPASMISACCCHLPRNGLSEQGSSFLRSQGHRCGLNFQLDSGKEYVGLRSFRGLPAGQVLARPSICRCPELDLAELGGRQWPGCHGCLKHFCEKVGLSVVESLWNTSLFWGLQFPCLLTCGIVPIT